MPRRARIVIPGLPHHVTQRGNRRQTTFLRPEDYSTWLNLARKAFAASGVEVWAYCLMPNHLHLIAAPADPAGLATAMAATNLRYTRLINEREGWRGYLWQGRFWSHPMDEAYLLQCVRYVGLNPVRAGLVQVAAEWPWSSVAAHLGGRGHALLTPGPVAGLLRDSPAGFFESDVTSDGLSAIRAASRTGRPLGGEGWIRDLESRLGRSLSAPKRGRPAGRA